MNTTLNELVGRLTNPQEVECSRPSKTAKALKECIDRNYIHVMFKQTGTEVGVTLKKDECSWREDDFQKSNGEALLVGGLTLNYNRVKCSVRINLQTCEGTGNLTPVGEEEYKEMMEAAKN